MQIEFTGKTVVVTGAAHGMGRAMAVAFAAADVMAGTPAPAPRRPAMETREQARRGPCWS